MKQVNLQVAIVRSSFFDGSKNKKVYYLVGLFAFTSMRDLYWLLDESSDPLSCEYKEIEYGGFYVNCDVDILDEDNFRYEASPTENLCMMHEENGTDWKEISYD